MLSQSPVSIQKVTEYTWQALFTTILPDLGLPKLDRCDRVTLTRLDDQGLTTAILVESPEPVSFIHDVTLTLIHKIRRLVPPRPVVSQPGKLAAALLPPARVPAAQIVRPPILQPPVPPIGPGPGTWVEEDIVVAATLVSNGDESSTLVTPASPLPAGSYTLTLTLTRSRWETTTGAPQATHQDAATIPPAW